MSAWSVGQELKTIAKPAITRDQLREYAAASGDNNPVHLDENFAKAAGFPSVIVHGMISMAFMADHLKSAFPDPHKVVRFKTRFRKITFPGDELLCGGNVKKIGEDGSISVGLWIRNQKGETTTEGEAEIAPHQG